MTVTDLYNKTSAERRQFFEKALDPETATQVNALFEKAMLSNQSQALKNWIWKHLYSGVPLYVGLSLDDSRKMRESLSIADLKQMTPEQRQAKFEQFVDESTAKNLNASFDRLNRSGNLANWEQRAFGTDALHADRKLKGAFARLETLNDLGVLSPKQMDKFMEDYVSDLLGVNVTAEESAEIGRKVTAVSDAFAAVGGNWTADNRDKVLSYFQKRKDLETLVNRLDPESPLEVFIDVGARGSILFSLRSLSNSFLYQVVPSLSRAFVKRIAANTQIPGDYSTMDRITNAISGTFSAPQLKAMAAQVRMGMRIYYETGYDISRMEHLDDGFRYFGEKFTHTEGPSFKEAEGIRAKLGVIVRGHSKLMTPGLKWAAGGTDVLLANIHRADTSNLLARTIAIAETRAGKIAKAEQDARIAELYKDSMRPDPQTDEGAYIREMGILDAHHANFTNNDIYGRIAMKIRDSIGIGDATIGKVIIPFLRIPANALGVGLEMAGPGLIRGGKQLFTALQMEAGNDKQVAVAEGIAKLLTSGGGLALAAIFVSALLDDDDYIGAYDYVKRNENALSITKNAGANYVRIGGHWYSTRWFGPLGIPISAMMEARQARAKGSSAAFGYFRGMLTGALQFPGLKEAGEWLESFERASKAKDVGGIAKALNAEPGDFAKWIAVRTVTGTVAHDVWGFTTKDRYDALGRKIPHKRDDPFMAVASFFVGANIKYDTSNEITREFDRLSLKGQLPSLTDPRGERVDQLKATMGEDAYVQYLNELKQTYAAKVEDLINEPEYQAMSPEEQKKAIDKIRDVRILREIEASVKGVSSKQAMQDGVDSIVKDLRSRIEKLKGTPEHDAWKRAGTIPRVVQNELDDKINSNYIKTDDIEQVTRRLQDGDQVYQIGAARSAEDTIDAFNRAMSQANSDDARELIVSRLLRKYRRASSEESKALYRMAARKFNVVLE